MPSIDSTFFDIGTMDAISRQDTFVHRMDPRIKVLTTLVFIVCVVSFGKHDISALIPFLVYPLFLVVLGDIIVANINVARLVLGPMSRLKPAFIEIPLDTDSDFVATILGSIITLTPGTVSIDIDRERRILHVHALDVEDTAALVSEIKTRYEAPLKEIFGC